MSLIDAYNESTAERCRRDLYFFVRRFWSTAESYPFIDNWHVEAICLHLQALAKGHIKRLCINIPPGHAKSLLTNVYFPAWVWTWRPTWRAIFSSYAEDLTIRDSIKCRRVIESPEYQRLFGIAFSKDENSKEYFSNTKGGVRISTSVGGGNTGHRGDFVAVDDPQKVLDSNVQTKRDVVVTWWDQAMSTRVNKPSEAAFLVMMQRTHENDLAGHVLSQGYTSLKLSSLFDPGKRCVTQDDRGAQLWSDPRQQANEPLFPQLYTSDVLKQLKIVLGATAFNAQHQQEPYPEEGLMFKNEWWRFYVT